jgi:mannose-1-phosphate guanylyltransferase
MSGLIQPVIMAGGSGTRLWPLSRAGYPKQFLVLQGNESLLQQAAQRLAALGGAAAPIVVGNEEHRFLILDQLREARCTPSAVLLEPAGRNTAPAVTLAALQATQGGADPVLVITPADQTVTDPAAFTAALERATHEAAEGAVVILGITPDRPETGYGYIQAGELAPPGAAPNPGGPSAAPDSRLKARPVQRFVEKPDAATAAAYLAEGGYFWNGGIFVLRASTWLQALQRFRPDILAATRAMRARPGTPPGPAIIVGQSAGGWGALALAAQDPPEVSRIVNMAGGRGGRQNDQPNNVCRPERLVSAAGAFGQMARMPTLWIYAANDSFFGPGLARDMAQAWRLSGAPVTLRQKPAFGRDGHGLFFGQGGSAIWGPEVEAFLR